MYHLTPGAGMHIIWHILRGYVIKLCQAFVCKKQPCFAAKDVLKITTQKLAGVLPAFELWFWMANRTGDLRLCRPTMYNVGPTSKTLGRSCTNGLRMFCVCWVIIIFFTHRMRAATAVQVLYSTPDQSKSGPTCHMPRSSIIQLLFKSAEEYSEDTDYSISQQHK